MALLTIFETGSTIIICKEIIYRGGHSHLVLRYRADGKKPKWKRNSTRHKTNETSEKKHTNASCPKGGKRSKIMAGRTSLHTWFAR